MPVTIPEVLNNADLTPQVYKVLMAIVPNVKQLTLSPALIGQGTSAEQIFPCAGLAVGDFVYVIKPTVQAGLSIGGARVSSAGNIGILFVNTPSAGGNITPTAAETYLIIHAPGLLSGRPNILP